MSWNNIPKEMQELPQWVGATETKIPINPMTGKTASVDDPSTWGTFEQACNCGLPHIGFVFTESDPYIFIDLDTGKKPELAKMHAEIVVEADSYTETSISKTGSHIVVKGTMPAGLRADKQAIELYPHGRYMLMTGWLYHGGEIKEAQELIDYLSGQIQNTRVSSDFELISVSSNYSDEEVYQRALNADNGVKFRDLYNGEWQSYEEYANDHSRADLALATFLDFYTKDVEQVARMFTASKLYRSEKGRRNGDGMDYVYRTIKQARARNDKDTPPMVDASVAIERAAKAMREKAAVTKVEKVVADDLLLPPGLVGEIAQYIFTTAIRPVKEVALMGALAFVAGMVGRQFNIPGSGLNLYLILLAPTGSGKEGAASGISSLIAKVRETVPSIDQFIGPAEFSSGPALIKALDNQPALFSILGEFGLRLQQMADSRANGAEKTLQKALLNIYSKSGWHQTESSTAYSDREKNTSTLYAPALTILGESTPETFFAKLTEEQVLSGLLPRFLFMEYTGLRPLKNSVSAFCDPDPTLVKKVADLAATCIQFQANNQCQPVIISGEAQALYDEFDRKCDARINTGSEVYKQLWNRSHLKALRLGAVIAVGCNAVNPTITADIAQWSLAVVEKDSAIITDRFENETIGEGEHLFESLVRKVTEDYLAMDYKTRLGYKIPKSIINEPGIIPFTFYRRRLRQLAAFKNDKKGPVWAVDSALKDMVSADILNLMPPVQAKDKFGLTTNLYVLGQMY